MTNKELFSLAGNEEALYYLDEIRNDIRNMVHKTTYERKRAKQRMKDCASIIKKLIAQDAIDEAR